MRQRPAHRWRRLPVCENRVRRLWRGEDGAGTVYALIILSLCMMLGGLAIDTVNARRGRAELSVIADVAAHAGVVALAQNATPDEVEEAVERIAALNGAEALLQSPPTANGLPGTNSAVTFLTYDPDLNQVHRLADNDIRPNAVALDVRYDAANLTAIPTYFLGMIGISSWSLERKSVAALVPPSRCAQGDTLLSRDLLLGEGKLEINNGYCLHAQRQMEFSRTPEVEQGASLSLPNLDGCLAGCADMLDVVQARAAMAEVNMLQPDYRQHIDAMAQAFNSPSSNSPERLAFFEARPIAQDLSTLAEVGVLLDDLKTGSVVDLEPVQIQLARHLPQGLVYRVSCASEPQETFLLLGGPGPTMNGSVLLTDCPVVVSRTIGLSRGLIISTWDGIAGADLPAIEVMASGSSGACSSSRSILMANLPVYLLPDASGNGLGVVSATDVALFAASGDKAATDHRGLAVYAGTNAYIEGEHRFEACGVSDAENLLPQMRVIRQVMPENMDSIYPPDHAAPARPRHITPKEPSHNVSRGEVLASLP